MARLIDELLVADGDESAKLAQLEVLHPDQWLDLDHGAREQLWSAEEAPYRGPADTLAYQLAARPTTLTAVLASMAGSGYLREAATRRLAVDPASAATMALALRTADHVESIRRIAQDALEQRANYRALWVGMPLLLRLNRRSHGELDWFLKAQAAQGRTQPGRLLMTHPDPITRRWGFRNADIDAVQALRLLAEEHDQQIVRELVRIVARTGKQTFLVRLLAARQSQARETGMLALPAEQFSVAELHRMLLDKATRVRRVAGEKLSKRGESVAEIYQSLWRETRSPRALAGLATYGSLPLDELRQLVVDPDYRIRREALRMMPAHQLEDEDIALLWRCLDTASHPGEDKRVAQALGSVTHRWGYEAIAHRWTRVDSQRRLTLWQLGTHRGGWDRIRASLLAATDPDPQVRGAGVATLRSGWARLWGDPTPRQLADLRQLLPQTELPEDIRHTLEWRIALVKSTEANNLFLDRTADSLRAHTPAS